MDYTTPKPPMATGPTGVTEHVGRRGPGTGGTSKRHTTVARWTRTRQAPARKRERRRNVMIYVCVYFSEAIYICVHDMQTP